MKKVFKGRKDTCIFMASEQVEFELIADPRVSRFFKLSSYIKQDAAIQQNDTTFRPESTSCVPA